MKRIFKVVATSFIFAFIFLLVASLAAPTFVRQDQVLAFLEKNIKLPEGKKLKIDSKVKFGVFPYSFVEVARAEIVSQDGKTQTIENILLGFTFNDIISKGIDFDFHATVENTEYKGNLDIKNFRSFRENRKSPINLSLQLPVELNLKGDLEFVGNTKKLSNFILVHNNSMAQGNLKIGTSKDKTNSVSGDVVINTSNVDEIRRLLDFKNTSGYTPINGKGYTKFTFETSGKEDMQYKKNLKAQGTLQITNAELYGFDLNEFINNPIAYQYKQDPTKKTYVDQINANFSALDGVLGLAGINAYNSVAKIVANGSINLLSEQIDMMSDISTAISGQNLSIPVVISGNVNKPKITPNIGEGIARNLPSVIQNPKVQEFIENPENKKIVDKVNKALEGIGGVDGLMNIFNNNDQPAEK